MRASFPKCVASPTRHAPTTDFPPCRPRKFHAMSLFISANLTRILLLYMAHDGWWVFEDMRAIQNYALMRAFHINNDINSSPFYLW